jgi:hypothetical protein
MMLYIVYTEARRCDIVNGFQLFAEYNFNTILENSGKDEVYRTHQPLVTTDSVKL